MIERIDEGLKEIEQIITMAQAQRRLLLEMRDGKRGLEKKGDPSFICKKCGKEVFFPDGYKFKGSYFCVECNLEETEGISITQEIINAIDEYIADKHIIYRREEGNSNTQTILKVINTVTDSSAIIRITNLDWL